MRGRSATIAGVRAAAIVLSGIGYTGRNIGGNKASARGGRGMFKAIATPEIFNRVHVAFGVPTWPGGIDPDAATWQ